MNKQNPMDWVRYTLNYPIRLAIYGAIALLTSQYVFSMIAVHGIGYSGQENGPVERAQVVLALFTSVALFFAASRCGVGRTGLILCACLVGYAAARECDRWFETVFFDDAYKYLAGIPLATVFVIALYRGRTVVLRESHWLLRTPAMTIYACGGIFICSVCQVLDRPDLWSAVPQGDSTELTKSAVEEMAELFGYLLLAFSGIESILMTFAQQQTVALSLSTETDEHSDLIQAA